MLKKYDAGILQPTSRSSVWSNTRWEKHKGLDTDVGFEGSYGLIGLSWGESGHPILLSLLPHWFVSLSFQQVQHDSTGVQHRSVHPRSLWPHAWQHPAAHWTWTVFNVSPIGQQECTANWLVSICCHVISVWNVIWCWCRTIRCWLCFIAEGKMKWMPSVVQLWPPFCFSMYISDACIGSSPFLCRAHFCKVSFSVRILFCKDTLSRQCLLYIVVDAMCLDSYCCVFSWGICVGHLIELHAREYCPQVITCVLMNNVVRNVSLCFLWCLKGNMFYNMKRSFWVLTGEMKWDIIAILRCVGFHFDDIDG